MLAAESSEEAVNLITVETRLPQRLSNVANQ
jgi:hypothetical protein